MLTTDHLRRRWAGIVSVLVATVLVAGILAALAGRMERHEEVLDTRGRRTVAVVVGTEARRRLPDTATVRYEHDGREYEADVTVNRVGDFPVGAQREVVYDPVHPTHAKPVVGWSTSYGTVTMFAVLALGAGVVHSGFRTASTLRLRTIGGDGTAMRVESFQLMRWWQRRYRYWAALWPLDADPTQVDAPLYVPIEELASKPIGFEEPSTVLGVPEPGHLVVILHRDQAVWPRGRVRRHPPRGSDVSGRVRLAEPLGRWP